jgi:chromosome segregation ATPase
VRALQKAQELIEGRDEAIASLQQRIVWEQTERSKVVDQIQGLQNNILRLQGEISKREQALAALQRKNTCMHSRIEELEVTLRLRESTRDRMAFAHDKTLQECQVLTGKLRTAEEALTTWVQGSHGVGLALDLCERAMTKARREREHKDQLEAARLAVDVQVSKLMCEHNDALSAVEIALNAALQDSAKREGQLHTLQKRVKEVEQENRAQVVTIDTLRQAVRDVQVRVSESLNTINALRSELSQARSGQEDTDRSVTKEKERAERAEAKIVELIRNMEEYEQERDKERDALVNKCAELEGKCTRVKNEVAWGKQELERERETFEALRQRMATELRAAQAAGVVHVCVCLECRGWPLGPRWMRCMHGITSLCMYVCECMYVCVCTLCMYVRKCICGEWRLSAYVNGVQGRWLLCHYRIHTYVRTLT